MKSQFRLDKLFAKSGNYGEMCDDSLSLRFVSVIIQIIQISYEIRIVFRSFDKMFFFVSNVLTDTLIKNVYHA